MTMLKTTKTEPDFTSSVSVVNGIDTDAVHALIESVEAQPAQGMTHWRVASAWQGGARSLAQVDGFMIGGASVPRHFSIDIDEPFELGGSNAYAAHCKGSRCRSWRSPPTEISTYAGFSGSIRRSLPAFVS